MSFHSAVIGRHVSWSDSDDDEFNKPYISNHSFTKAIGIKSNQTNYQLSPSEDKISFIKKNSEVRVYDVFFVKLEEQISFKQQQKIFSHVAIHDPDKLTIFSGNENGSIWEWNSKTRTVTFFCNTVIKHPIIALWHNENRDLLISFDKQVFTVFKIKEKITLTTFQVLLSDPIGAYVNFPSLGSKMITCCYERNEKSLQKLMLWDLDSSNKTIEKEMPLAGHTTTA